MTDCALKPSLSSQLEEEPELLYGFKVVNPSSPISVWMVLCELDSEQEALFVSDEARLPLTGPEGEKLSTSEYQGTTIPVPTTLSGALAQAKEQRTNPCLNNYYKNLKFVFCKRGDSWDLISLEDGNTISL